MFAVLAIVITVVVSLFVLFPQYRPKWNKNRQAGSSIRLLIPLAESVGFDQGSFRKEYTGRWEGNVFCESMDKDGIYDASYLLTDPSHNSVLSLKYSSVPLETAIINLLVGQGDRGFSDNKILTDEEKTDLRNSKAFIEIQCEIENREAAESLEFIAKTLLTVFENQPAVGYANPSAQSYRPKSRLIEFQSKTRLCRSDLFLMFVNVQIVSEEEFINIHTHGMEQFKLPDLQIAFPEKAETNYHFNVLRTAAVYIVENGDVLKNGHTWQLEGDRTVFRVMPLKGDKGHFGSYGTIGLKRTVAMRRG